MNRILIPMILVTTFSLLFPSLAISEIKGEIKATPPLNWEPSPTNNSTTMIGFKILQKASLQ